jgi:hypothetical protein
VRLAVVVPSDNLDHGEALLEDLVPASEEQITRGEDPVLARKVGVEPRGDRSEVGLSVEPALISSIVLSNSDVDAVRRSSVLAIAIPSLFET